MSASSGGKEGKMAECIFDKLHYTVTSQVLEHLDGWSLRQASQTCKELRQLSLLLVTKVRVPNDVNRKQLLIFPASPYPAAHKLLVSGEYENLRPADFDEWWRSQQALQQFTHVVLSEMLLTGPLPVSTFNSLCSRWSHVRHVELHDVRLTCPLDCTEPVALDNLVRRLYQMQKKPLPHITLLRNLVSEHETRLECNLLVTSKVFEALSRLPQLTHLSIKSTFLHPHNEAVAHLSACTTLTHLTLQLPEDTFPSITEHGLRRLPRSLQHVHLITTRAVRLWRSLAALSEPDEEGHQVFTAGAGSVSSQVHSQSSWHPAHYNTQQGCQELQLHIEGTLGDPHKLSKLPGGQLPPLASLVSSRLRSTCQEAPEPEDPEEVVPDNPQEVEEAKALTAMLAAAPQLQALHIINAGPVITRTLATLAPKVPRASLHVACQSRVDASQLLCCQPAAKLSLTLKGVSAQQLDQLVAVASAQSSTHLEAATSSSTQQQPHPLHRAQQDTDPMGRSDPNSENGALAVSGAGSEHQAVSGGALVSLHFQRSHELTDELLAAALKALPSVTHLTLTTCRSVTCDIVMEMAKLLRPIRLRVTGCRLISARGWEAAIMTAREVSGSWLVDVRYPSQDDLGLEVAFR